MIRFTPFWRRRRFATQSVEMAEGLDAFQRETETFLHARAKPRRLVVVLATVAVIEGVPASLWLYQAYRGSAFMTPATATAAAAAVIPIKPTEVEPAPPPVATPPIVPQEPIRATPSPPAATPKPASVATQGPLGGHIAVTSPVPMRIYARGRIIGTTEAETIMLPVGTHDLSFVSEETGYNASRTVKVQAGKTTTIQLESPTGTVNVNASPWAEVWIDNKRIGDTPMGNLRLPIGVREFVFRHPELGERRKTALVTLKEPVRVTVDMRTK